MIVFPADVAKSYEQKLSSEKVPDSYRNFYRKWMRYFWDFCHKYGFNTSDPKSLAPFMEKLQTKKQSPAFQRQAHHAVTLYHELLNEQAKGASSSAPSQYRATTLGLPLQVSEVLPTSSSLPVDGKETIQPSPSTEGRESNPPTPAPLPRGGSRDNDIREALQPPVSVREIPPHEQWNKSLTEFTKDTIEGPT